ncbi:MAG TPA: hypothetical protein VNI01_16745 [Elusimicrobiota bacterium]|jgi:hypothetical protein|nr:hypothetical protein [Elusimicrobiota bacterium]
MSDGVISYTYRFTLPDGSCKEFRFGLNEETLELVRVPRDSYPEWTNLEFSKCPNCPLRASEHPQCPVAANLTDVIDFFKGAVSSDTINLDIVTDVRSVSKRTSMANGVSALLGVVNVTSGCPVLDKLRPMLRTHLPFSSIEETMYRTLSMYTMAQFFRLRRGLTPDWKMERLLDLFEEIRLVNRAFCQRLYAACTKDANVNALIHLDSFVELTNFALLKKKDRIDRLERVFSAYLEGLPPSSSTDS